ncbi:hypothetical protein BP00DRAFT_158991 [Aspergillus indologenus CBS 114.80]|uniref:Uncharacterized protein n=1 Tax=Aspergillus indologenus CBS 114.80 TaxID=1450541 RepID=A0A2V5IDY3_9EURO|nr:hypothetical protein BP00DRAFT_158991 [Aspergillus indologenus CBS 114.80]
MLQDSDKRIMSFHVFSQSTVQGTLCLNLKAMVPSQGDNPIKDRSKTRRDGDYRLGGCSDILVCQTNKVSQANHVLRLTWKVEYSDVLRHIPETIRQEPPPSNYRPSRWKTAPKDPQYSFPRSRQSRAYPPRKPLQAKVATVTRNCVRRLPHQPRADQAAKKKKKKKKKQR